MLFNDKVLFLHVPKAAGTSVTSFLIRNLAGLVTITEPSYPAWISGQAPSGARLRLAFRRIRHEISLRLRPRLRRIAGTRHENLGEASEALARLGRKLEDFEVILAVVRNPYDMEVSRFNFLRRGHLGIPGLAQNYPEKLALAGDFAAFADRAPYHGRLPGRLGAWFEIDGQMPSNLRVVRFETLEQDLRAALMPFCRNLSALPRLNPSQHKPYAEYLSPDVEEAIYRKYRWVFDRGFYRRELLRT
jgi:hypothetical protein